MSSLPTFGTVGRIAALISVLCYLPKGMHFIPLLNLVRARNIEAHTISPREFPLLTWTIPLLNMVLEYGIRQAIFIRSRDNAFRISPTMFQDNPANRKYQMLCPDRILSPNSNTVTITTTSIAAYDGNERVCYNQNFNQL